LKDEHGTPHGRTHTILTDAMVFVWLTRPRGVLPDNGLDPLSEFCPKFPTRLASEEDMNAVNT
jgi:hypothetical protein